MTAEILTVLLRANLAASVLIALVMIVRKPVRRQFGAQVAYGLWWGPLAAAAATLLPARTETVAQETATLVPMTFPTTGAIAPAAGPFLDFWTVAALIWAVGTVASLAWLALSQTRYLAAARRGKAGPAVVGFLRPSIVVPADFDDRFDAHERDIVMAHEGTHLKRQDARVVAFADLIRCLNWFNPLVHLAVIQMRIDQELACDEAVVGAQPGVARAYAETMLKAQMAARPLPLGCAWPGVGPHPLAERIALLAGPRPSRGRVLAGAALVLLAGLSCGAIAWASLPPRPIAAPSHAATIDVATTEPGGSSPRATAASQQLLAEAVPTTPEGNPMMKTQQTPGHARRLAGAAVVGALGLGIGSPTLAAPDPQLTNSQSAPTYQPAPPAPPNQSVVSFQGRRMVSPEEDARRVAALSAALGLPEGSRPNMNCAISGSVVSGQAPQAATRSCGYTLNGGPRVALSEDVVNRLIASGVLPPAPPAPGAGMVRFVGAPPPPPPPPGE